MALLALFLLTPSILIKFYFFFIVFIATYAFIAGDFLSRESEKLEGKVQQQSSVPILRQHSHPLSVDRIVSILLKLENLMKEGKISRSVFQKLEDYYANELKKSLEEERINIEEPETNPY